MRAESICRKATCRYGFALWLGAAVVASLRARAAVVAGSAPPAPSSSSAQISATCVEQIPEGKTRPEFKERFPEKIRAGYAEYLEFTTEHGRAESVLVDSSHFSQSDATKALEQTRFVVPDPHGGITAKLTTVTLGDRVTSTLRMPFVALPGDTKQRSLTLPPVPVAIRRANGETMTLCTQPHLVIVEPPTANTPEARPRPNPGLRRQLEEWTSLKQAVKIGSIGLLAGAVLAGLVWLWLKRPRKLPPPPPPRPPWEVAFEELSALKGLELLRAQRFADFYAKVSDTVRKYLGGRYGYDGLECTTREAVSQLQRQGIGHSIFHSINEFLAQADLVKFARLTPSEPECLNALQNAETIVTATLPDQQASPGAIENPEQGAEP
jgi:hypothetical protein